MKNAFSFKEIGFSTIGKAGKVAIESVSIDIFFPKKIFPTYIKVFRTPNIFPLKMMRKGLLPLLTLSTFYKHLQQKSGAKGMPVLAGRLLHYDDWV